MTRYLRKHRTALIALAVYNVVLFFPVLFMGRVLSPNDVFYNYSPWAEHRPAGLQTQNPLLNDPPMSYLTLMTLVKDDWRAFHWNPYIAAGIPGFGSSAAAVLSPFILFPLLLVPLTWVFTAIVFLKVNLAWLFAYLWLREEKMGRRGAAIGAIVIAGSGIYAVRWLWQITNATALYPALLWIVRRILNGRRVSIAGVALIALAYALSGFPAAMAYGAWAAVLYAAASLVANRRIAWRRVATGGLAALAAVALALLIALPSLVPFVQLLRRSGYLEARELASQSAVLPLSHLPSFVDPDRLGSPVYKDWTGERSLGGLNNYVDSTIYIGLLPLLLVFIGLFNRRARARWFWLGFGALVLACMFGAPLVAPFVSRLPGVKYSSLARLALLLPLPAGYLVAASIRFVSSKARFATAVVAAVIAFDLAHFAGNFHPYLESAVATVPRTATTDFLQAQKPPFRVAPFFDYLWPNSAELVRVEDVRSHFGSERDYRRLLHRLDATSWSGYSTVLTFNSLQFQFDDPLANLLGIRWYLEHRAIDIVKWRIFEATVPGVKETGPLPIRPGTVLQRSIRVDVEPFWAIELPVNIEEELGAGARLEVALIRNGAVVFARNYAKRDLNAMNKIYIPIRPWARLGESVVLRARSVGLKGWALAGENSVAGETPLFYGRVTKPLIFDRELEDGRLFLNLAEIPRFRAVTKVRKLNDEEFLAAKDVDFTQETVITDDPVMPPDLAPVEANVTLASWAADEQRVVTESPGPFFLASSEKLTPELAVTIDGQPARPVEVDMMFAGLPVPAGRHEIVFTRRIARGWWWLAVVGVALWLALASWEGLEALRRRRKAS